MRRHFPLSGVKANVCLVLCYRTKSSQQWLPAHHSPAGLEQQVFNPLMHGSENQVQQLESCSWRCQSLPHAVPSQGRFCFTCLKQSQVWNRTGGYFAWCCSAVWWLWIYSHLLSLSLPPGLLQVCSDRLLTDICCCITQRSSPGMLSPAG